MRLPNRPLAVNGKILEILNNLVQFYVKEIPKKRYLVVYALLGFKGKIQDKKRFLPIFP